MKTSQHILGRIDVLCEWRVNDRHWDLSPPFCRISMQTFKYLGRKRITSLWWVSSKYYTIHYIPCFNEVERGVYWFHLVRPSVCGQNHVRSASSTILVGSISYLHILSSNFRRCVACNVCSKNQKIVWNFGEFFEFLSLTFIFFWLGIQYDSVVWVIMRRWGVSSERRRSSCSIGSYTPAQRSWRGGILDSPCPSVCPSVRPSVCRRHGFRSISQVCFGISISNFICMLMVAIGRSLLIFSDVTFKMAAWRPYWIFWFPDSNFTSALNINFKLQRHNTYVYG